jgi:NADH-quinone oxidoreductase subunit A
MEEQAVTGAVYWPLWLYFGGVLTVIAGMLSLSFVLGQRSRNLEKSVPYESGISSTGSAHGRFYAGFFLMAIFFVIFDLESIFVVAWAIAARELGWAGYGAVCVFIGALFVSLIYLWREGALES